MLRKSACVVLAVALGLTGCNNVSNQDAGVLGGAALGGFLGNHIGGGAGRAVATLAGAAVGAVVGGRIGETMDQVDRQRMNQTFEHNRTGQSSSWTNPDSGNTYRLTPRNTFTREGRPCREFSYRARVGQKMQEVYGTACRSSDGGWQMQ